MKTNIKNILKASLLSAFAFLSVGCNTDPEYHSTVAPEIFFTTQETVWQRFSRPLTHWKWHFATNDHHSDVQFLGTDEMAIPTKGTDWYDGGQYQNMHWHDFRPTVGMFHNNFYGVGMGVGFTAALLLCDYRTIRPIARKSGVRLKVRERHGLPFLLGKYKARCGLLIGLLLLLKKFIIFVSSHIPK